MAMQFSNETGKEKERKGYKEGHIKFEVSGNKIYGSKLQGSVWARDLYLSHQYATQAKGPE